MVNWIYRIGGDVRKILRWIFFLLMGTQIVLGIGWMLANMDHQPLFRETLLLLEAAENNVIDEYMGMLYPLLIVGAGQLAQIMSLPYYMLLYVVQLLTAGGAMLYLLKCMGWGFDTVRRKIRAAFAVGYLLTFPLLLQLHMAVLPYSFAMSLTVILVCDGFRYMHHPDEMSGKALVKMCGLWCLDALLLPDYSWLAGVFVVGVVGKILMQNKAWRVRIVISLLGAMLCIGLSGMLTQTPGSMGRIQKSASASLMHRFVWPNFGWNYFFWDDRIKEIYDYGEMEDIAKYTEEVIYQFGPTLEEAYGLKEANELYLNMAWTALKVDTKQIVSGVGRDMAAYLCPPAAWQYQTDKNSSSLLGWNYGRLQEEAPLLTKYYTRIALAGWDVLCMLGVFLILLKKNKKALSYRKVLLIVCTVFMAGWYTMQGAGMQDYKNVMLISLLWLFPIVSGFEIIQKKTL